MAAGGGLYITAVFGTILILIALTFLGNLESRFGLRLVLNTYEVLGPDTEAVLSEINRILNTEQLITQNVRVAGTPEQRRVVFSVLCSRPDQEQLSVLLHESPLFSSVSSVGSAEHE
jgi:uncharacterized membrane protein YhiD involved in acid resistance